MVYRCDRCGVLAEKSEIVFNGNFHTTTWSKDLCKECYEDLISFLCGAPLHKPWED